MTSHSALPPNANSPEVNLERIKQHADQLANGTSEVLHQFIDNYYQTPDQHFGQSPERHQTAENLAGIALHHFSLLQRYQYMVPQVEVFNPNYDTVQFHSPHSIIQIVASDRPFLVDTLLMSLDSMNITVHRLHNTIMAVNRDDANQVTNVSTTTTSDTKFISLIYCEIARQSEDALAAIRNAILDKIKVLDVVVTDWKAMRDKLIEIKHELADSHLPANALATTDAPDNLN